MGDLCPAQKDRGAREEGRKRDILCAHNALWYEELE